MGARRSGREAALQILFQIDITGHTPENAIALFWPNFGTDPEGTTYANRAVHGVIEHLHEIDPKIVAASTHWRIERMTRVDRTLLRLGTWELIYQPEIPRAVILDEAVELAKEYGTDESSSFINGVLNQIAEALGRQDSDRGQQPI